MIHLCIEIIHMYGVGVRFYKNFFTKIYFFIGII